MSSTRFLLGLALGRHSAAPVAEEWPDLFAGAHQHRLLSLAWKRSRDVIAAHAPPDIAARWYRAAIGAGLVARDQLRVLTEAVATLRARGCTPLVLKGPPLAQRLYGDATVRPMGDLDLYIPRQERADAFDALLDAGWQHDSGEAPDEETFSRGAPGSRRLLEVHSVLLDDPLLGHLASLPVDREDVDVDGSVLPTHSGALLPAFLAAHLAKHRTVPLLWILDFHALLRGNRGLESDRMRSASREAGLDAHLAQAEALAVLVDAAADGDAVAEAALEKRLRPVGEIGRVWRLMRLSSTTRHAIAVVAGRVFPSTPSASLRSSPRRTIARGARWISRHVLRGEPLPPDRALPLSRPKTPTDVLMLDGSVECAMQSAAPIWVRQESGSMDPTIPPHAAARVVSVPGEVSAGDIVLARLRRGHVALLRVATAQGKSLILRGDALRSREWRVDREDVLGVCDLINTGAHVWHVEDRPRDPLAFLLAQARGRMRRHLA